MLNILQICGSVSKTRIGDEASPSSSVSQFIKSKPSCKGTPISSSCCQSPINKKFEKSCSTSSISSLASHLPRAVDCKQAVSHSYQTTASPSSRAKLEQAKLTLRSCSKNKQWTELMRDVTGKINITNVQDLGQQKSSRKKIKKNNIQENKHKPDTGVA